MRFYGWQKISYIDYPEKLSTLLFTGGCNLRCPFCHNPELVLLKEQSEFINSDEIVNFLRKRKGLLDGVAITGGEPLLHAEALREFAQHIKKLDFLLKIDTNGTLPDRILALKDMVDFWAMDFKVPLPKYKLLAKRDYSKEIEESLYIITKELNVDYEIRTTLYPTLVDLESLKEMAKRLPSDTVWVWQQFRPIKTLSPQASTVHPYERSQIEVFKREVSNYFKGRIELRE